MAKLRCSFDSVLRYLNECLESAERQRITLHLNACDICRDTFYELFRDRAAESSGRTADRGQNELTAGT
jgi:hypothetical protein